ncbi:MAG: shikimate dehydrogenase [Gallionellales bacterium RIFCSPLOWO2_12_FULL_59_22]|nr:MAG: shikimate dehydrogenase [Gallionellales bacterium RIFCSPLOWO2_02_FULL_59_110]OGT05709.1 MAG: shikimate dehydrogenase [Gallionellales bacterium RIFCSPLOWO2_02_58_13]OGT13951.1 MAG: shikimate dehydrogenase [Gallionellales bacterium RIFCSPLOWO2_12_FULL_59_22]
MTDKYAVIGNPVSHSKSPLIHRIFAEQTGQDISYEAIEAPLDGFAATIERLREQGYKGCNVTVPFKFEAFGLASQPSERARAARAVNTLKFDAGEIYGDNTDGAGLVRDIEHNLGVSLKNRRVLLMGAGGAAYGVVLPLRHAGARIAIANRTAEKARQLAAAFSASGDVSGCGYDELAGQQFEAVINATSAGLTDSEIPLPTTVFAPGALAYDMMYGRETPFMKFARAHGARVSDGLGMLVEQAAEAFFIWRGVRPNTAPVMVKLREVA